MGISGRKGKAVWFCLAAILIASCSSEEFLGPVVKTDLSKSISAAIKIAINTSEGAAAGNYAIGAHSTLVSAITTAQLVYADKNATQAQIDSANTVLNDAVTVYKSKVIVEIDPDNLVGQWTFDQLAVATLGVIVQDYSGRKNDGKMSVGHSNWGSGVPTLAVDRYGVDLKSLHFSGGANIEIPYNAALNTANMSIALWVKIDVLDPIIDNQYLVSMNRDRGYHLNFRNSQRMAFTVNPAENPGGTQVVTNFSPIVQGSWFHLVITVGGGHMVYYINGVQDFEMIFTGSILKQDPGVNLVFGQDLPTNVYTKNPPDPTYVANGGYFIGALDEIRIYKSVLTADQVTRIYNLEKPE